jgi:hypothetical protein
MCGESGNCDDVDSTRTATKARTVMAQRGILEGAVWFRRREV